MASKQVTHHVLLTWLSQYRIVTVFYPCQRNTGAFIEMKSADNACS